MIRAVLAAALVAVFASSVFIVVVALVGLAADARRGRRFDRHCDSAGVKDSRARHTSAPRGLEDTTTWSDQWGVGRP